MSQLLLTGAEIYTLDPAFPRADTLAIQDGRILAVGWRESMRGPVFAGWERLDLDGRTILPGFIDAHLHFRALAESRVILNVGPDSGVASIGDIGEKIRRQTFRQPPGTWIRAAGYDETALAEGRDPNRFDLDPVSPRHPVKLVHRSGHAHVLNSRALERLGITRETPDPPGGWMERDLSDGEPTGIFYGHSDPFRDLMPPLPEDLLFKGVVLADRELIQAGITTFQDASYRNNRSRWLAFREWKSKGFIQSHVVMHLGWEGFQEYLSDPASFGDPLPGLKLGGVKIVIDETTGRIFPEQRELNERVLAVHRAGFQAVLHALEEPAIAAALQAIEYAQKKFYRTDPRHRIEHASVCPSDLVQKIAASGAMVVTHPGFLYFSGDRYRQTVPSNHFPHLYRLGTFLKKGIPLAAASDAPIVPPDPRAGIYGAVTRRSRKGVEILPEEKITPIQALVLYTAKAAYSSFDEKEKGTLTPGKAADLVVLNANPFKAEEEALNEFRVEMTLVGGNIVYKA